MTDQPARYRRRPAEIEAVQWTDTNADALAAFAGHRFMTVDPEDRIDDADATASLIESAHECWSLLRPGDWVVKRGEDDFAVLTTEEFADLYEAAPATEADPLDLRASIASALRVHYHCPGDLDPDGPIPCRCGWMDPGPDATHETDFDAHMADVVLAVLTSGNQAAEETGR